MTSVAPRADGETTIEVDVRPAACLFPGCGGAVVRHSLGGGVAVDRCTRCFRRYQLRPAAAADPRSPIRRVLDEFLTWQDDS